MCVDRLGARAIMDTGLRLWQNLRTFCTKSAKIAVQMLEPDHTGQIRYEMERYATGKDIIALAETDASISQALMKKFVHASKSAVRAWARLKCILGCRTIASHVLLFSVMGWVGYRTRRT